MLSTTEAQKLKRPKSVFNFFFLIPTRDYKLIFEKRFLLTRPNCSTYLWYMHRTESYRYYYTTIVIFDCIHFNIIQYNHIIINVTKYRKSDDMLLNTWSLYTKQLLDFKKILLLCFLISWLKYFFLPKYYVLTSRRCHYHKGYKLRV